MIMSKDAPAAALPRLTMPHLRLLLLDDRLVHSN